MHDARHALSEDMGKYSKEHYIEFRGSRVGGHGEDEYRTDRNGPTGGRMGTAAEGECKDRFKRSVAGDEEKRERQVAARTH
eukprot:7239620-Lingulodinium_polyedra.AAC.1